MGIYRVTSQATGNVGTGPFVNVMHIQPASDALADVQAAVDVIRDFYTTIRVIYDVGTFWTIGSRVLRVDVNPDEITPVTPRGVQGSGTGGSAAPQLAQVVSWRTPLAGRSFRGRTYLGPLAQGAIANSQLASAASTAVIAGITPLVTASIIGVYSQWDHKVKRPVPLFTKITQGATSANLETQRRRAS